MKSFLRFVLPALAVSFISATAFAQTGGTNAYLKGSWVGKLKIQAVELTFVINFSFTEKDSLVVTIDSPDQGAKDIPTSKVTFLEDSIFVSSKTLHGIYKARILKEENKMDGVWIQGFYTLPLILTRQEGKYEVLRPQEPKPPFPYQQEEVTFSNPAAGITLGGTLTIPEGTGPFPAAVLITGSGAQNRNEELFQHKPFLVLADWLTRHGIAVLRCDDRSIGSSGGNFATSTTYDFATDALAALNYLRTRKEVDTSKTGLIGHSEGGIIAPIVASENRSVKFIVMMAGTGMDGEKILLKQNALIMKASGASDTVIAEIEKVNTRIYNILKKEKDESKAKSKISRFLKTQNEKEHKKSGTPLLTDQEIDTKTATIVTPWLRTFIILDPSKYLMKVHCPVLAIDGELDLQVPPKENLDAIEKSLILAGNSHYEIVLFPKLNHLFQTATTGLPVEYGKIGETIAPVVLEKISDWILQNTK